MVLIGNTIFVVNLGDTRAVISRYNYVAKNVKRFR